MPAFTRLVAAALIGLAVQAAHPLPVGAQEIVREPVAMPEPWLQGFVRAVSGELLIYPWAYPGQAPALLSRTTDGSMAVEWEGAPAGEGSPDDRVTWIWHAGLASGSGAHHFTLWVNGSPLAGFTSGRDSSDREWTVQGVSGAFLAFKTTRVGTFNELFGFMMLTLPRGLAGAGVPRFRVVPDAAGSRDYYMTFQREVGAWVRALPVEAVLSGGRRALRIEVSHVAPNAPMAVICGDETAWSGAVAPGHTSLLVPTRAVSGGTADVPVSVRIGDRAAFSGRVSLPAVRSWQIHLLPHSHVDIGYSDPQPEVEKKQWLNLRDAVALARKTASYPPEARFRWNVEGLWSVESYLKQAGAAERAAFAQAVKEGAVSLQANYTNILTGLASAEELRRWTDGMRRLSSAYGLPAGHSAMQTDIPGLSWTVVSALAQAGVRYFSSGPNYMPGLPDRGDRIGLTLKTLGDRPFWWVSPSGQDRVLFWMAGRGYSWFHGLNTGSVGPATRDVILGYLEELSDSGYQYDLVQVRYTIGGDNGPADANLPDFVRTWNETFDAPRLVIDTADSLFLEFDRRYGSTLPSMSGDMTPYWEDGAVSSAAEETLTRQSVRQLEQAEALWSLRNPRGFPEDEAAEAWRQAILWHEHTWGAADSIGAPDRADVASQWQYKRAFALEASRRSAAMIEAAKPAAPPPPSTPPFDPKVLRRQPGPMTTIEIVNTLSWPRSGLVLVPGAVSFPGDSVTDARGRLLPTQRLAGGSLAVWCENVPAFGAIRLRIQAGRGADVNPPVRIDGTTIDNGRVRVEVDADTGAIRSLRWNGSTGTEFVASDSGLGAYLYVPGRDPSAAVSSGRSRVTVKARGPLLATIRIESDAPGASNLVRRVSVVAGEDQVRFDADLEKSAVRTKESAHLAFPFSIPDGIIRVDQGEALVEIERNQLPGSCRDFIGVQGAIDVSDGRIGVSLVTLDAPLVELGALTDERLVNDGPRAWRERVAPGATLYAYLLNNYWHTNYKAYQAGTLSFRFVIRPHAAFDGMALRQFGAGHAQPLLAYPVDPKKATTVRAPFLVAGVGVIVSAVRPVDGGRALLVRLYNASAKATAARLTSAQRGRLLRASLANADGKATGVLKGDVRLPAYGTATIRIDLSR